MRDLILKEFLNKPFLKASDLTKKFGVTRQAVFRHLQGLLREGKILRQGTSRKTAFYVLNSPGAIRSLQKEGRSFRKRYRTEGLKEDSVYEELRRQPHLLNLLSEEARTIFHYAFTEMLNNAIDHSRTRFVDVEVHSSPHLATFSVTDRGLGVYENIQKKKGLADEMEALQDLLKGKQTTLPEYHSGEGIFFTSKAADRFILESHRKRLTMNNQLPDIFVEDTHFRNGTRVIFELNPKTKRKLEDVFRQYTKEDYQFQKSRVTVKLFQEGEEYMSRSQAKRLLHSLERFQEVILDFQGVRTIGQGFADEIFRVYPSQHPEIKFVPVNGNENILFMIDRAKAGVS